MLTVIDEYTREALCVAVRSTMNAHDVLDVLFKLILKRGKPKFILSDKGSEFIVKHLQTWLRKVGINQSKFIQAHLGKTAITNTSMARYGTKF